MRPPITRMQVMNLLRGMLASMRDNLAVSRRRLRRLRPFPFPSISNATDPVLSCW